MILKIFNIEIQIHKHPFPQDSFRQILLDLNASIKLIEDFESLIGSILSRLHEILDTDDIYLFWKDPDSKQYKPAASYDGKIPECSFDRDSKFIRWLSINERSLEIGKESIYDSLYTVNERIILKSLNVWSIHPLINENNLRGFILIGELSQRSHSRKDTIRLFEDLLDNITLAIDNALYREEKQKTLVNMLRADRLAALGKLAAGAAHEIRNPLAGIKSSVQYIRKFILPEEKRKYVDLVVDEVNRIDQIVSGLMFFSKQTEPRKKEIDLSTIVTEVLTLIQSAKYGKEIMFELIKNPQKKYRLRADPYLLKQVLVNVILNSIDSLDKKGNIMIRVDEYSGDRGNGYIVSVEDDGQGIAPEDLDNIFIPFFTTKTSGTGLGLPISYGIIQQHGGKIDISSVPNQGTKVMIELPLK